jgi:hypothetical protein
MRSSRWSLSKAAFLTLAFAVFASTLAAAQSWSSPQFVANGLGIGVASNGAGTSAVLFISSSSVLQASVKTGSLFRKSVFL